MSALRRLPSLCYLRVVRSAAFVRKRLARSSLSARLVYALLSCLLVFAASVLSLCALRALASHPSHRFHHHVLRRAAARWPSRPARGVLVDELWNQVKDDVVIGVKTGHEVAHARLHKLKTHGWWSVGRHVPNLVIVGDRDDVDLGVVGVRNYGIDLLHRFANHSHHQTSSRSSHQSDQHPDMPSHWFDKTGWRGDKDKNLPALHLMYTMYPGKKWYLLLDDDTYIFLENFARYILQDAMDDIPVYTGKVFYISRCGGFGRDGTWAANKTEPKGMFAHGGSGIIINSKAMDVLYPRITSCIRSYSSCWAGDMQVGLCLREGGVLVRAQTLKKPHERDFIPFWPSKALSDRRYSARWKSEEEPITFHKIPDREMQLMSEFERVTIHNGDTVVYNELRRHLMSNGILPCHTEHNKKTRYYSNEFMPKHLK